MSDNSNEQHGVTHGNSTARLQRHGKILALVASIAVLVLVFANQKNDNVPVSNLEPQARRIATTQQVVRPTVPEPLDIVLMGGGSGTGYTTTRNVRSELSLSLDAQDIRADNATDTTDQMKIYMNGSRSFRIDAAGNKVSWSLAALSLESGTKFQQDPLYQIHRRAFLEVGVHEAHEHFGDFDDHPVEEYANTLVMDLFVIKRGNYVELTAALVLNVWMAVAHELNEVLRSCKRGDEAMYMEAAVDRAAALWIGQGYGNLEDGEMLYTFTQRAAQAFGQNPLSQALANKEIVKHLNDIQTLVKENKCDDGGAYLEIRQHVDTLHGYMTVPLVQQLIWSITEREGDWTELFALSFLPRVAFCNPQAYKRLFELLVLRDLADEDMQEALDTIESILGCLHISCEMLGSIGTTSSSTFPIGQDNSTTVISTPCDGNEEDLPPTVLAGYELASDVDQIAHIDNDLLHIRLFMESQAYDAAEDYYRYGQDSRPFDRLLSLHDLARSDDRSMAPQFQIISDYSEVSGYSAHDIIMKALRREAPFDTASPDQLTEVVVGTLQSMVMHMAVLQHLYIAVDQCRTEIDSQPDDNPIPGYGFSRNDYTDEFVKIWDVGAAFFIGSLQGEQEQGSDLGQFLFAAGSDFCEPFGTCANLVYARTNKNVIGALMDGQNALSLDDCDGAADILEKEIVPQLLVPLVQGTLFYAAAINDLPAGTIDGSLGAGFAFSHSILPFVHAVDPAAAQVVATNMDFQLGSKPVGDGVGAVYEAIRKTILTGELGIAMPMVLSRNAANITLTQ